MLRYTERLLHRDERPTSRYEYYVSGRGEFPVDMLRYDSAWPADTDSAVLMMYDKEVRSVRLYSYKMPTEGRWSSFMWSVGKERM